MSYTPAEVAFLAAHDAEISAAAENLSYRPTDAIADAQLLSTRFGDNSRAVHELLTARHKTAGKLPATWLMCSESSQQATPAVVAEHRAQRILRYAGSDAVAHDVTCSIGTEVAALAEAGIPTLGSDIDPVRAAMAKHNLCSARTQSRSHAPAATAVMVADALHPSSTAAVIVADPARRAGGRRITSPQDLIPPLPALIDSYQGRELAIKCAPGLDFSDWVGCVSLTSVGGGVKEACLYTPGLAGDETREAIIIRDTFTERIDDTADDACPVEDMGRYLIDPDGAIVRAGLVTQFATRYGLAQIDPRIAYLTGDDIPPGYSGFPVLEVVAPKKVGAAVKKYGFGRIEILMRGIAGDPDALRKKYKPSGPNAGAIVLTRIGRTGVAVVCGARETRPRI